MPFVPIGEVRPGVPAGAALLLAAAVIGAGGAAVYYHFRENQTAQMTADQQAHTLAALNDARGQIQALSARLDVLSAAAAPARLPALTSAVPATPARKRTAARQRVAASKTDDPRFKQIESQLSDQQKQLSQAREDLETKLDSAREDMQGRLDSARDELGTSIAKNHDEVVALERRGERRYHEFTLAKSKDFQTVGPLSLSLRKTDTKHRSYNLAMVVADARLEKKHVNLFEPVMVSLDDRPQPVELVVNQISKDEIRGYISEPKYKHSELAGDNLSETKQPQLLLR